MYNDGKREYTRAEVIVYLAERDGYDCRFPGCTLEFDGDRHRVTVDHITPQKVCKDNGWTYEEINHVDNLQLMGKSCNARKGQLEYDENGNLPVKPNSRRPKVPRPEHCDLCLNGRILLPGEECPICGSGPQPVGSPRSLQLDPKECRANGHRAPNHCWVCYLGFEERQPAIIDVLDLEDD